jgi:transposase
MSDGGDSFVGRCEVAEPRRGNRGWSLDLKARIVDVARRHGVVAHQLSDWRRRKKHSMRDPRSWGYRSDRHFALAAPYD